MAAVSSRIHELDAEFIDPAAQGGRSTLSSKEAKAKFLLKKKKGSLPIIPGGEHGGTKTVF